MMVLMVCPELPSSLRNAAAIMTRKSCSTFMLLSQVQFLARLRQQHPGEPALKSKALF
jgi:hypothetical protein